MCKSSVFQLVRLCVLGFVLLFGASEARSAPRRAVFFESAANAHPSLNAVLDATRAPLAELGVELSVAPRPAATSLAATTNAAKRVAQSTQALAVVWLDAERMRGNSAVLYFFDAARARLLTRQVQVSDSESAAAEEVAVVLRSAVGALLEGEEVAMTEVALPEVKKEPLAALTPPAPPARPAPQAPSRPNSFSVGLSYVGSIFNDQGTWQSGARLALALRPFASRWWLGAAYEVLLPLDADGAGATTRVARHPAELSVARELLPGRLRVAPELALIADAVHRETREVDADLEATAPSTRWLWALSMRLRGRCVLGERSSLWGSLGADFVLNPFEQVAAQPGAERAVASLLVVRPHVEAGFLFDLW
jgi:hypothetical protein